MLTRVPYVANGQGGTDEGSIGGIDETIDSMTNAAEISVGVCWAGGEILSLTSRLNESYKTLQLRGTEGPNCKPVSGHSVSLHLGTHLTCVVIYLLRGLRLCNIATLVNAFDRV